MGGELAAHCEEDQKGHLSGDLHEGFDAISQGDREREHLARLAARWMACRWPEQGVRTPDFGKWLVRLVPMTTR